MPLKKNWVEEKVYVVVQEYKGQKYTPIYYKVNFYTGMDNVSLLAFATSYFSEVISN